MSVMGIILLLLVAVILVRMFVTYDSKNLNGFEAFVINKDRHYSIRANRPFPSEYKLSFAPSRTLRFTAIFADGCAYMSDNHDVTDDINKLYGINYGWHWHNNSVRIGWRYNAGLRMIELFMYSYVNGKREFEKLMNVNTFEAVHFTMFHARKVSKVVVEVKTEDGVWHTDAVMGIKDSWIKFKLFPYFGGNMPAPQNMKILIRD